MSTAAKAHRATFRQFLYDSFPVTHVGVLNIRALVRASYSGMDWTASVYSHFLRKFNHNIWGRHRGQKQVGAVAVAHNRKHVDNTHIHVGFWGLPTKFTQAELKSEFLNAAAHTPGVQYTHTDSAALAAFFEPCAGSKRWLNYSSRLIGWQGDDWDDCLFALTADAVAVGAVYTADAVS